jgi:rhodanese-related sulfurtransferase
MPVRNTTPPEAQRILAADPSAVYLDVRTEGEFEAGHPAGARNVPVLLLDPATRQPRPNRDFVAVVQRHFPRGTKLLVGCQSGGRSLRACELLADAGYTDLTNVEGGFGGAHDAGGRVVVQGWRDAGLPVERGVTPGASYADLAKG